MLARATRLAFFGGWVLVAQPACAVVVDGSDYPCSTDADCGWGWRCDVVSSRCAEEVQAQQTPPSCQDECNAVGKSECMGADFRTCLAAVGPDECQKWGPIQSCDFDRACQPGTGDCDRQLAWREVELVAPGLYGMWGISQDEVWAVGDAGSIWFFNGSGWSEQTSPVSADLRGVWGTGPDAMWAVGVGGQILRRTVAQGWQDDGSPTDQNLNTIIGFSESDIWAAGQGGLVLHNAGQGWSEVAGADDSIYALWGPAPGTDLWAVGYWGTVWERVDDTWKAVVDCRGEFRPPDFNYFAIWGTAKDALWVGGASGYMARFNGEYWDIWNRSTADLDIKAIWGASRTDFWAVGSRGRMLHSDGVDWPSSYSHTQDSADVFEAVWGSSRDDVWLVGHNNGQAVVYHFN